MSISKINVLGAVKMRMVKMRMTLIVIFILTNISGFAGPLEDFLESGAVDPESVAVLVADIENGKVLAAHNIDKPLVPASIMKTVTIASLLPESGKDYRYITRVYTDGPVRDGVLEGNLIVVGSGDPSLNANCGPASADIITEITDALVKKKIKRIEGRIITDQQIFSGPACPPSWASGDLSQSYGTGIHGLNFERNASGKRAVSNPASIFESRLRTAMVNEGITVAGESVREGERKELIAHKSAPIEEIMRSCMMRSDNLFAESLLRTYSVLKGGDGSTDDATRRETEYWKRKGLPMQGVNIVDGSGLSRSNRLTADFLENVLAEMSESVEYASFMPLAGQEGTLKHFLAGSPLDSYVAMKTGSMNGIQCYAGYKLDDDFAPTHTIVVIINNMKNRATARAALAKMLLGLFEGENAS